MCPIKSISDQDKNRLLTKQILIFLKKLEMKNKQEQPRETLSNGINSNNGTEGYINGIKTSASVGGRRIIAGIRVGQSARILERLGVLIRLATGRVAAVLRRLQGVARAVAADVRAVLVGGDERGRANVSDVLDAVDDGAGAGAAVDEVAAVGLDPDLDVEAVFQAQLVVDHGLVDGEVEEGDRESRWRGVADYVA